MAIVLFTVFALFDLANRMIPRRFNGRAAFSAIADSLVDKLLVLALTLLFTLQHSLPWMFALAKFFAMP